jgi:hypothetical protein
MLHRMSSCTPGAGDLEFRDVESKSVMQLQPCCVERAAMCWRLVELPEALRVTASSEARIIAAPSFPKG